MVRTILITGLQILVAIPTAACILCALLGYVILSKLAELRNEKI